VQKKLLKAVTDITVLEKKELPRADFFRSYNLEGYSGQLLVKPDEFKTNLDRKKNETSIIYLSSEKNILYFSSYGEDESNGKDIYRVVRLPNGGWSKPYNVGYPINTEYDEDYPFLHPNGKVLYFSSKGHNSMGGYDIFRSESNEETGSWLKPSNMDFAINSPDDDIMFVPDVDEKTAWFASSRNSPQGLMTVYHVVIERKPANMQVIAGTFKPTGVDPTANAKITVRNEETNQPVGVYNSNSSTGKYLINLPNTGGKYTFTVEKSGIHTQTKTVFMPPQYELKPIRQEIFYTESDGEQNLNVVTYFDDDTASFAPDFLIDKANLDVNPDASTNTYEVVDLGNPGGTGDPSGTGDPVDENDSSDIPGGGTDPSDSVPSSSQGAVSTAELISTAFENADLTRKDAVKLHQQTDRAFTYAAGLNLQAIAAQKSADSAKVVADGLPDGPEKQAAVLAWQNFQSKANTLQSQTVAAFNIANGLNEDANHTDVADKYALALQKGSKNTGPNAMDEANSLEQQMHDMSGVRSQAEETAKNAQEEADTKRDGLQLVKSQLGDDKEEEAAIIGLIEQLRADSAKEKDPELRAGYGAQIEGAQENLAEIREGIRVKQAKVNRMTNELNQLDAIAAGSKAAIGAAKDPSVAPVALSPEDRKGLQDDVVGYQNRVEDSNNPTVYAPVTQTPNTQNPVVTNPNTQNPETQNPNTQNPVVTNPNTQNPQTQNPNTQNPETQNPNTQNPVVTNPNTQNPETQNPNTQNPVVTNPNTQNPETQNPNTQNPVVTNPNTQNPETQNPNTQNPVVTNPNTQNPETQNPNTQNPVVTNPNTQNPETQNPNTQNPVVTNPNTQNPETQDPNTQSPEDPFTEYITAIADADTMSDPVAREGEKAKTYGEWGTALKSKIAEDKKLLGSTKDKAAKDSLKLLIAAEEEQLKGVQQDEKTAKGAEQAAITEYNSPGATSERAFEEQVTAANNNPNVEEREGTKETIYNNWADSLDREATVLEGLAVKERNPTKKAGINQKAAELRAGAQEKRDLADDAHVAGDNARTGNPVVTNPNTQNPETQNPNTQNPVVTNPNTQNPVVTNPNTQNPETQNPNTQNPVVTNPNTQNPNTQNPVVTNPNAQNPETQNPNTQNPVVTNPNTQNPGVTNPNTQNPNTQNPVALNPIVEDNITYTDPEAQTALGNRDSLNAEAQVYRNQQDSLIAAAGQASGPEKTDLMAEATAAQRKAWEKDADASAEQGKANEEQFGTNAGVLDTYVAAAAGNNDDKVVQAGLVNDESRVYLQKAKDKRREASLATSPYERKRALDEAEDFELKAIERQQEALRLFQQAGVQPGAVVQNPNTQDPNVRVGNPNTQNPVVTNPNTQNPVVTNPNTQNPVVQNPNTQQPNTQPVDPANTSRVATQLKQGETFKITSQPNTQPIPVDPPVPSGIIYKVQVGAFRNPIPVDQFRGIQPLTAESVGNGITRYTAGQFVDFGNADAAKREIRAMGYSDAFVVAYKDGKRISIADARREQGGANDPVVTNPNTQQPNTQQPNTQQPNTQQPNTQTPVVTNPNTQQPTYQNQAPAIDVATTKELFYTVQVGVYSRPVSSAKLYNLTGLFSERTQNGYIRYAAGKYNNLQAATDAKNNIVNIGVKDAFVTAYFEGQRISVERAAELERSGVVPAGAGVANAQTGNQAPAQPQAPTWEPNNQAQPETQPVTPPVTQPETQPVVAQPVITQPETQPVTPPVDMTPIPVIANTKPNVPDTGLVFSVQLGAYQQFVPIAMANRFLLFASKGVSIYRDAGSGLTVYQVGVYGNYKEAAQLKDDAMAKGINDAFIVAWKDGEKISMEEALKIRPQ
jgi:hypothetical protein